MVVFGFSLCISDLHFARFALCLHKERKHRTRDRKGGTVKGKDSKSNGQHGRAPLKLIAGGGSQHLVSPLTLAAPSTDLGKVIPFPSWRRGTGQTWRQTCLLLSMLDSGAEDSLE